MPIPEITPEELARRLNAPESERPVLVDVRTWGEHQIVALPESVLIPLHELEERHEELDAHRGRELVVYCHHGIRSRYAVAYLGTLGHDAKSLLGGVELYATQVDPTLPRY